MQDIGSWSSIQLRPFLVPCFELMDFRFLVWVREISDKLKIQKKKGTDNDYCNCNMKHHQDQCTLKDTYFEMSLITTTIQHYVCRKVYTVLEQLSVWYL